MTASLYHVILLGVSLSISYGQPTKIIVNPINEVKVMPGQESDLQVTVLYQKQVTPVIVNATVVSGDAQVVSGPWFISSEMSQDIAVTLHGTPEQTVTISFWIVGNESISDEVNATLTPCILGFKFANTTGQCLCDEYLSTIGIYCSTTSGSIGVPYPYWFGPVPIDNVTELGRMNCLENYCKHSASVIITNNDFSFQCDRESHRLGVGCGSCKSNYSAILGSSQCWECNNISLILVLLFLVTGILTVTGIAMLRITITEGYLNAVLFYSNVANLFAQYFSPAATGKGAFFLVAWISQTFGVPACFYNGMTTLAVTGLHLLYVLYLFALTGLLTLVLRSKKLPSSEQYTPSKVIGTMLVICYTSLLDNCVSILSFSYVTTLNGQTLVRWYYDANVVYFSGIHGFLCVVAILIFPLFLIPFPLLIISPRITYKVRFFNKLQPLLDTFWAPFKSKYCWWLSFRLFVRWIVVFVASFVPTPYNIIGVSMLLTLFLLMHSHLKPFRGYWQNLLDEVLVVDLLVLLIGYFLFHNSNSLLKEEGVLTYGAVLVVIAYLLFIAVLGHHLSLRFPKCKPFLQSQLKRLKNLLLCRHMYTSMEELSTQELDEAPPPVTHSEISISTDEREEDKLSLTRELHELESLSESAAAETKAKPQTTTKSRPKISLKENKDTLEEFPLLKTKRFTEDREPLLADDNV